MRQNILVLLGICGLILFAVSCGEGEKAAPKENQKDSQEVEKEPGDSIVLVFQGQSGRSVFEIMDDEHEVDYIGSAVGNFVNAIDSLEVNSKYGWLYSVNGVMGTVASDKYITDDSDIVRWHYRKF